MSLRIPAGSVTALLGPNGAGKSTLLQCAVGLLAPDAGDIRVLGTPVAQLTPAHRARIGYVAESQPLPGDLTLAQYERWLAPLYPRWDHTLADSLRARFALDPARRLKAFSRGQRMQAALLCALAPRPDVLFMDEPFAGLDAAIKDDLVRGVLELSGSEGWTVVIASHDLTELELLVDHVAFLKDGTLRLHESMDTLRTHYRWVDVQTGARDVRLPSPLPAEWVRAETAGTRVRALLRVADEDTTRNMLHSMYPNTTRITFTDASLTDVFIGLARDPRGERTVGSSPLLP
ncbi:MAG: ABC transporter ATP-binding protein [Gemmatimonadaceae bacterium]|nr:ABC transporter ATP-binding protein [Gemmatimonadaceae bacterium]